MHRQRGFTLLELMVNVAIVGILASIAISAFDSYRKRAYEANAIHYLRSWVPAQEMYLNAFGHYASADEDLQNNLGILKVPASIPYNFSLDNGSSQTQRWWGRGQPLDDDLRYFYIDETGVVISSMSGPPSPP